MNTSAFSESEALFAKYMLMFFLLTSPTEKTSRHNIEIKVLTSITS